MKKKYISIRSTDGFKEKVQFLARQKNMNMTEYIEHLIEKDEKEMQQKVDINNHSILIDRVLKAIVNWNGQKVEILHSFLKYQDEFMLLIDSDHDKVTLKTVLKGMM